MRQSNLWCALLMLATWPVASGCQSAPVTDVHAHTPRVALLPLVNLSGCDLQSVPGVFWESAAIQRLMTRTKRLTAPLEHLPFPADALATRQSEPGSPLQQLAYNKEERQLIWAESMLPSDRELLDSLSEDSAWRTAVKQLWEQNMERSRRVDVYAALREAVQHKLGNLGFVVADLPESALSSDSAPPPTGKDPAYINRLRAAASATQANGVLTVSVEEWDWSDLFETGEVHVALSAVIADPADGRPIWNRRTGRIVCKVPDELARTGMIDLTAAWPRYVALLTDRLFD